MLGLCAIDLHVRPYGRQIEVSVGSTRREIIEITLKTFEKYGEVYRYTYIDKKCNLLTEVILTYLPRSFTFLLKAKNPTFTLDEEFFSYLAGVVDGDGRIVFRTDRIRS